MTTIPMLPVLDREIKAEEMAVALLVDLEEVDLSMHHWIRMGLGAVEDEVVRREPLPQNVQSITQCKR
jgi:hypothetical protein